jgi:hypothetical protein
MNTNTSYIDKPRIISELPPEDVIWAAKSQPKRKE